MGWGRHLAYSGHIAIPHWRLSRSRSPWQGPGVAWGWLRLHMARPVSSWPFLPFDRLTGADRAGGRASRPHASLCAPFGYRSRRVPAQSRTQPAKSSGLLQATLLVPICQRLNVERGVGAASRRRSGKNPGPNMDRPKPGVWWPFPPTAPSRQPPLRRWKFARLISSSHPHSLVASCLPRCRLAACLIRAPSLSRSLSPDCARYVAPSVTVPVVCLCSTAPPVSKGPRSVRHLAHTTRVRLHEHVWPQQRGNDPPHVVRRRG